MSRPDIFAQPDDEEDLDLSAFRPKAAPEAQGPPVDLVRQVTEAARFPSRQAPAAPPAPPAREPHKPRLWRTGRTAMFAAKITPEAHAGFYRIADAHNMKIGEVVERALAALQREMGEGAIVPPDGKP
jgi:hypothetical protein